MRSHLRRKRVTKCVLIVSRLFFFFFFFLLLVGPLFVFLIHRVWRWMRVRVPRVLLVNKRNIDMLVYYHAAEERGRGRRKIRAMNTPSAVMMSSTSSSSSSSCVTCKKNHFLFLLFFHDPRLTGASLSIKLYHRLRRYPICLPFFALLIEKLIDRGSNPFCFHCVDSSKLLLTFLTSTIDYDGLSKCRYRFDKQ